MTDDELLRVSEAADALLDQWLVWLTLRYPEFGEALERSLGLDEDKVARGLLNG